MDAEIWNGPTAAQFDSVAEFVRAIPAEQFDMERCSINNTDSCGCVLHHARLEAIRRGQDTVVQQFAMKLQLSHKHALFAFPLMGYGDSYSTPRGEAGKQEFLARLEQLKQKYCREEA